MKAAILLLVIVNVSGKLPDNVCIRGGSPCTAAQKTSSECDDEDKGYCCVYEKPVEDSIRCFCKPGYGAKGCKTTLGDPDWMTHGQEDLKKFLAAKQNEGVAKNVILFLGDGLGISTVTPSRIYKGQLDGKTGEESSFAFEEFPFVGLAKTYLVDHQIADSSGTATSILSGVKANYGTVGVNSNVIRSDCAASVGNEVTTILEWSQMEGKSTGVVTNTRVTHATPASAFASVAERNWECDADFVDKWGNDWKALAGDEYNCTDVAHQFVHTMPGAAINVMLGGGRTKFLPNTTVDPEYTNKYGSRKDGRDLTQEWMDLHDDDDASYVWNKAQFDAVDPDDTEYLFGLFEPSHMRYDYDNVNDGSGEPTLTEMVEKAIKILQKDDDGFFLLVEGGRIDHGHHAGMAKIALDETVAFDLAVRKALNLTDVNDTLIVLTADHSHAFTMGGYTGRGNPILGFVDTYDIEPSLDGKPRTTLAYHDGMGAVFNQARPDPSQDDTDSFEYLQQALVPTTEESHGGEDVPIYATGPMAHLLTGVHDQLYIAHVLAYASCVGANKDHCSLPIPEVQSLPNPQPSPQPCSGGTMPGSGLMLPLLAAAVSVNYNWI